MTPAAKWFPSAGRRLAAAMISYQVGYSGVDRVLGQYREKKIDPWFEKKAQQILREMLKRKLDVKPRAQTPRM